MVQLSTAYDFHRDFAIAIVTSFEYLALGIVILCYAFLLNMIWTSYEENMIDPAFGAEKGIEGVVVPIFEVEIESDLTFSRALVIWIET